MLPINLEIKERIPLCFFGGNESFLVPLIYYQGSDLLALQVPAFHLLLSCREIFQFSLSSYYVFTMCVQVLLSQRPFLALR